MKYKEFFIPHVLHRGDKGCPASLLASTHSVNRLMSLPHHRGMQGTQPDHCTSWAVPGHTQSLHQKNSTQPGPPSELWSSVWPDPPPSNRPSLDTGTCHPKQHAWPSAPAWLAPPLWHGTPSPATMTKCPQTNRPVNMTHCVIHGTPGQMAPLPDTAQYTWPDIGTCHRGQRHLTWCHQKIRHTAATQWTGLPLNKWTHHHQPTHLTYLPGLPDC